MLPLNLSIQDFGAHSNTEFSFKDFQSALVLGKVKDNERFSNGSGKSTIFNAIEYVLFNEVKFSSLEKIIRDGCEVCKVRYDFVSSLDGATYRIVRSNSRKTGTDVRLFKCINEENDQWEDLTQRRVSDTEKEIIKIIGFNYKSFCASAIFSQSGSENNVQKDFGNLPNLTPEKRKSVLREVLQLNIYANYEKLAKTKYASIQSELEKNKIILSTIGDPDLQIKELDKEELDNDKNLSILNSDLEKIKNDLLHANEQYTAATEKEKVSSNKIYELDSRLKSELAQCSKYENLIVGLKSKISALPEEAKALKKQAAEITSNIEVLKSSKLDVAPIAIELERATQEFHTEKNTFSNIIKELNDLKKPITDEKVCSHCHQIVSETHKKSWQEAAIVREKELEQEKDSLQKNLSILQEKITNFNKQITASQEASAKIVSLEVSLNGINASLETKREYYKNFNELMEENIKSLNSKKIEIEALKKELESFNLLKDEDNSKKIEDLRIAISILRNKEQTINQASNALIGKKAIIEHIKQECSDNKVKITDIKSSLVKLEKSLLLHSKVIQAFGSNGIPSLITHSILDDLQSEANKWLVKLRPGLQLQFIVVNDKTNKEQEDTLDIHYFIDGNQREYKQLSGAQKIIVSLAIKLGILFIMNKRLGIDIKLMLLDEVDQVMDEEATEIFSDIIKVISSELKVMVITHNDALKHKFSHAILVEQDINNVSKGKLISW